MKTFGLWIAAATLTLAGVAQAGTCSQQGMARAAALALDANRALSALPVSENTQTDVSPTGRKAIAALKDRLNDYTVAAMRCAPEKIVAADLKKTLAAFAGVKLPEGRATKKPDSGEASYGGELAYDVRALSPATVGIAARFGIACGEDAMLMFFERRGDMWTETLRKQSAPYKTIAGGWWSFDYGAARDKAGRWFVVTKNVAPWCSSTWSEIRYAMLRPGADAAHPHTLLSKTDNIWWGTDRTGDLKVDANGFDLRWRAQSMDGGVHNREWIAHYVVDGNRALRIAPIAESPRDFVDEWVRLDWNDAKNWTVAAAYGLKPLHDGLHKSGAGEYVSVRRCSDAGHTQIETEPGDGGSEHFFFQVGSDKVLLMVDASLLPDPRCKGPNAFDRNKTP